jgi:outer membrane biosynthesis protein TonB
MAMIPAVVCRARYLVLALAALTVPLAAAGRQPPQATAPRWLGGGLPTQNPMVVGGGEVILELEIDARGGVAQVRQVRDTPPFGEAMTSAVKSWRFAPATSTGAGGSTALAGSALVVALFRPPALYGGTTSGTPPQNRGAPSPRLPRVETMNLPAYPPNALGEGLVLVEIEMTRAAEARGYRVRSPASGFDSAALDAVRTWRFAAPAEPANVTGYFVYAVLGFRSPVGPASRPPP